MEINVTTNLDEIKRILCDPAIYPEITGDNPCDPDKYVPPADGVMYIGGYDKSIFAVSCFHRFEDGLKFHPNVLPSHRLKYGRDFVKQSLNVVKCKVYIEIPNKRKDLFNLAKKLGFDSLVNNKDSTTKVMRLSNGIH